MVVDRFRAHHRQPDLAAHRCGLDVQVVKHFDVIAQEPGGADHRRLQSTRALLAQVLVDVRPEPRILGTAAAALIHVRCVRRVHRVAQTFGNQASGRLELLTIGIALGHRDRNAVRAEDQPRGGAQVLGQCHDGAPDVLRVRADEAGMRKPVGHERHLHVGKTALENLRARSLHVLAVLRAARVAAMRGGDEPDRTANPGARHLRERVGQIRVPVAHADVHGQGSAGLLEAGSKSVSLHGGDSRERRQAAEHLVMMGHLVHALRRDAPPAQHVGDERPHVVRALRPSEGHHENGVEGFGHGMNLSADYTGLHMATRALDDTAARPRAESRGLSRAESRQAASTRLVSLDVFRGITMAAMVIVNNPGDWGNVYAPLLHADWHGWTPTDLIFPFFLFIVGVSITLSRKSAGWGSIFRRAAIIFALGLFLAGYPRFDLATWRIPGVLQRIAICYLVAAAAYRLTVGDRRQQGIVLASAAMALSVVYWLILAIVPAPGGVAGDLSPEANL